MTPEDPFTSGPPNGETDSLREGQVVPEPDTSAVSGTTDNGPVSTASIERGEPAPPAEASGAPDALPADALPADERPADERPADERPADERPAPQAAPTTPEASPAPAQPPHGEQNGQSPAAEPDAAQAAEPDAAQAAEPDAAQAAKGADAAEPDAAQAAEPDAAQGADAASGKPPRKKRRRRKKKKKVTAAEGGDSPEAAERKRKPQKSARAPERTPFHVGEEVFGRVTAVLDTAVMVDLSGKALAIFDRSEMEPDDLVPAEGDRFVGWVHQDGARGGLVVLTRKPLREEETKPKVEQAAKDGTLVRGLVTGVIKGGVDVDVGGLRAFCPASGLDLHPQNANFTTLVGQVLDFKVSSYEDKGRDVVVTRRPMLEAEAHERRKKALELLSEGQVMQGVVRTVVEWGIFVALPEAQNLEGLVHVSEVSHDPHPKLAELFKPGSHLEVKITKIDDKGKIWLSRKALIKDPWVDAKERHPPGSKLKGKVTRVEKFGVFVQIEEDIEGLIHVADLSLKRIEHPSEIMKVGDEVEVVVHSFDLKSRRIALHPAPPPEQADEAPQKVARNASVKVEVVRGEQAGVVVRLLGVTGRAARGFIPAGHTGTVRGTDLRKKFKPGAVLEAKVIELDPRRGEPKLSIRLHDQDEERRAHREYRQKLAREGGFGTLGDLLAHKLK